MTITEAQLKLAFEKVAKMGGAADKIDSQIERRAFLLELGAVRKNAMTRLDIDELKGGDAVNAYKGHTLAAKTITTGDLQKTLGSSFDFAQLKEKLGGASTQEVKPSSTTQTEKSSNKETVDSLINPDPKDDAQPIEAASLMKRVTLLSVLENETTPITAEKLSAVLIKDGAFSEFDKQENPNPREIVVALQKAMGKTLNVLFERKYSFPITKMPAEMQEQTSTVDKILNLYISSIPGAKLNSSGQYSIDLPSLDKLNSVGLFADEAKK